MQIPSSISFLGRLESNDIVPVIKVYRLLEVSVNPVSSRCVKYPKSPVDSFCRRGFLVVAYKLRGLPALVPTPFALFSALFVALLSAAAAAFGDHFFCWITLWRRDRVAGAFC